jgi:hypothetical protein
MQVLGRRQAKMQGEGVEKIQAKLFRISLHLLYNCLYNCDLYNLYLLLNHHFSHLIVFEGDLQCHLFIAQDFHCGKPSIDLECDSSGCGKSW